MSPLHLIALGWFVAVVAIAGPTWRREPTPFADDTAALAIVIKVTPSTMTEDVQPSRLSRSVQKVHDLLELRRGAKTALVAYAGSAHVVVPATTDDSIVNTFAQALDPKIMPGDGDAAADALALADRALADAGAGSILWITDTVSAEQRAPIATWHKKSGTLLHLLPPLLPGPEFDALSNLASPLGARIVKLTSDDSDVTVLARAAKFATATSGEQSARWKESGYWLTPVLAAILLPFYRRGWMASTVSRA